MVVFDEEKQQKKLETLRKEEEEQLAQTLSVKYGINYIDLTTVGINSDALRVISEADARAAHMAVFDIVAKKIKVAVLSPKNEATLKVLGELEEKGFLPTLYMVSQQSLQKVWGRYKELSYATETKGGSLDISNDEIIDFLGNVHDLDDVKRLIEEILKLKKSARISKILEIIVAGAMATGASDVHLEPEENYVRLRYRLDGVLTDILNLDHETFGLLLSRIKLLSGLKLNITTTPQDGRFSIKVKDKSIEIRTSVLPGAYNETIVLRVLNPESIYVDIENLGIEPHLLSVIEREIKRPNGMILTTGPTGSGKTTTLYAFLRKISSPEIKIITIENPIEYHFPGIVQTQVDPKSGSTFVTNDGTKEVKQTYNFSEGLRSALRQDPDVIMVGEIRDEETAETAVNAALTGHLVFSTLHTNNAAGSFPRLIDLGVNPKVITSAINISLAQRLVRKLCKYCKKQVEPDVQTKKRVAAILDSIKDKSLIPSPITFYEAQGCEKCNMSGYSGRIGIYEAILTDENIEKVVKENPSEREIKKAAEPQGILDMRQDGILKVVKGITSLEELERVVDLEEELK